MKQFGLIGKPLSSSRSKQYFENKFSTEGITAVYENFELEDISQLPELIKDRPELYGLNVTVPYKEVCIQYLNHVDETAQAIGAVNTICVERKDETTKLIGYNTDVIGFRKSLRPFIGPEHNKALILGTGGASKAVAHVLKELGIHFLFVSRSASQNDGVSYEQLTHEIMQQCRLIVNATPLGMYPADTMPPIPIQFVSDKHLIYDLIYNPAETALMKASKQQGAACVNGEAMFRFQAEAAWELWLSK